MFPTNFHSTRTESLPAVNFRLGFLEMIGDSIPEDADNFYRPIMQWIEAYLESDFVKNPQNSTTFTSKMDYYNTGSRPFLLDIVRKLNEIHKTGHPVFIKWYYMETESAEEDTQDVKFEELIDDFVLEVEFIPMKFI